MKPEEVKKKINSVKDGKTETEEISWKAIGSLALLDEFNKLSAHGIETIFDGDKRCIIISKRRKD